MYICNNFQSTTLILHIAGLSPAMKQHPSTEPLNSSISLQQSASSTSPVPLSSSSPAYRIIWCIPEPTTQDGVDSSSSTDEISQMFVLLRKSRASIINLPLLLRSHQFRPEKDTLDVEELNSCPAYLHIDGEHKSTILTACFSPDGTAMATGCADGEIGFFRLSFGDALGMRTSSTSENLSLMHKQVFRFFKVMIKS